MRHLHCLRSCTYSINAIKAIELPLVTQCIFSLYRERLFVPFVLSCPLCTYLVWPFSMANPAITVVAIWLAVKVNVFNDESY